VDIKNLEQHWHILKDAKANIGKSADSKKVLKWLRILDEGLHKELKKRLIKKGLPEEVFRRAKNAYEREKKRREEN